MNRRTSIAAAVVVTVLFFLIRLGIRLLAKEAEPPPSPVVDRSRSSPVLPPSPFQLKNEAGAKLRVLATEAREANETKAAVAAFAAEEAVRGEDCAGAKTNVARASDAMAKDSRARGALETAQRSVDAWCATVTDP